MIKIFSLNKNRIEEISSEKINLRQKNTLWVDLESPSQEEIDSIKGIFNIHPTTEEDIFLNHTRIKYEEFEENTFVVFKGVSHLQNTQTETYNISFIIGNNFIITSHLGENETIEYLISNIKKVEALMKKGKDYIFHYILDKETDKYMKIKNDLSEEFKKIELKFVKELKKETLEELFEKEMIFLELRQIMESTTDLCLNLIKPTDNYISNELLPYFRDIYDHSFKTTDSLKSMLGRINGMRNSYQSIISNKLNETMRTLTIIMAIMMPMTIITGFYGMNVNLPSQNSSDLWIFLGILMLGISTFMFFAFRRTYSKIR
jgi:magnesium transporter